MLQSRQIWSISDGRAGNARQADALAMALAALRSPIGSDRAQAGECDTECDTRVDCDAPAHGTTKQSAAAAAPSDAGWRALTVTVAAPWRWLSPRWLPRDAAAFGAPLCTAVAASDDRARGMHTSPQSEPPHPEPLLAVGCGRQAALATRWLRIRGRRSVQILDPRLSTSHWDAVITPAHDGLRGSNVISTIGSLHPVDDAWLATARRAFAAFEALPRPRTALLLGGSSAHARFERMAFEVLASKLEVPLAREGGSLLVTASRRTSNDVRAQLRHRYHDTPGVVWRDAGDGVNPYAGMLAWADRIVCSPDSVNMISEACATRVPVHVFDPSRVGGRPRAFLDALLARGRIRALDTRLSPFDVEPLRETARVAQLLHERLALDAGSSEI